MGYCFPRDRGRLGPRAGSPVRDLYRKAKSGRGFIRVSKPLQPSRAETFARYVRHTAVEGRYRNTQAG